MTINIGKEAKVPPVPIAGHKWGKVTHNNEVSWLAMWKENISGGTKYVWLSASSRIKVLSAPLLCAGSVSSVSNVSTVSNVTTVNVSSVSNMW